MEDRLQSAECAERLKALADRERLKIIQCLKDGPKTVGAVAELLGTTLANVSHHLRVLHHAGMVLDDKQGRCVVYSLRPDIFRPKSASQPADIVDLGCCRLELGPCVVRTRSGPDRV
jgi:DNA-binding transcriptional ArsR family regulator